MVSKLGIYNAFRVDPPLDSLFMTEGLNFSLVPYVCSRRHRVYNITAILVSKVSPIEKTIDWNKLLSTLSSIVLSLGETILFIKAVIS